MQAQSQIRIQSSGPSHEYLLYTQIGRKRMQIAIKILCETPSAGLPQLRRATVKSQHPGPSLEQDRPG